MNKLGVVHSGYKPIIPIGNRICLRFMLDDYQKGNFWNRKIADHDNRCKYIYLCKRTYKQQLQDSIRKKPEEIFFVLDTLINNFHSIQDMLKDIVHSSRSLGYRKEIIFSAVNEPLEHMSIKEIHWLNKLLSREVKKYDNVSLAVGEIACNFREYYKIYLDVKYHYDYISFHTDNNCKISNLRKFLKIWPKNVRFINNEHYHYNGSQKYGYDSDKVVEEFKLYTRCLILDYRIKSIYICMPFHALNCGKYEFLGLNIVNICTNKVFSTKAWKMLKQYDIRVVIKMYLKELKIDDRDFQVRALQKALNTTVENKLKVDGWFGPKTEKVIKEFNIFRNIPVSLVCSYATWYELLQSINTEVIVRDLMDLLKMIE